MLGDRGSVEGLVAADAAYKAFKSSIYNFWVPLESGGVVFNTLTGSGVQVQGASASLVRDLLCRKPQRIDLVQFPTTFQTRLVNDGLVVASDLDEVEVVRERYWAARGQTPMVLTITTTQDCNLGCYYCYESRTKDKLRADNLEAISNWTHDRLVNTKNRKLHVDWYGGEPLLNLDFMELASLELQKVCRELDVHYSASVISNGTCWPPDIALFIKRHKIRQVQISFDGMSANHNKRRRFVDKADTTKGRSSFNEAVSVVDRLGALARVDVRFNVDQGNQGDVDMFVAMCHERSWFVRPYPISFQLARISHYSDRTSFLSRVQLEEHEFEQLRSRVRKLVGEEDKLDENSSRARYPSPRYSVCAALADNSIVFGADGSQYRCGLQVGEKNRAVASAADNGTTLVGRDASWWEEFDPTKQENCKRCSFLPVCWGGCPKKHLERDSKTLDEQSLYWRRVLPQRIAWQFGERDFSNDFLFSEDEQFRIS